MLRWSKFAGVVELAVSYNFRSGWVGGSCAVSRDLGVSRLLRARLLGLTCTFVNWENKGDLVGNRSVFNSNSAVMVLGTSAVSLLVPLFYFYRGRSRINFIPRPRRNPAWSRPSIKPLESNSKSPDKSVFHSLRIESHSRNFHFIFMLRPLQ